MTTLKIEDEKMKSQMKHHIAELLQYLKGVKSVKPGPGESIEYTDDFCRSAYHTARYMHLCPNYNEFLTEEDKNTLRQYFQPSLSQIGRIIPGLVNNYEPQDLNIVKRRMSELEFIQNEIMELYKIACGDNETIEITDGVKKALDEIEDAFWMLKEQVETFSDPRCLHTEDNPDQIPNLAGVPSTHNWWSEEQLETYAEYE